MQFDVFSSNGLERILDVTYSLVEYAKVHDSVLLEISKDKNFKISGFRPGNIPLSVVRDYRQAEITEKTIQRLQGHALREYQKTIPEQIGVLLHSEQGNAVVNDEEVFVIRLHLEMTPSLEDRDLKGIKLQVPVVDEDLAVDEMVFALRQQLATFEAIDGHAVADSTVEFTSEATDSLGLKNQQLTFVEPLKISLDDKSLPFSVLSSFIGRKAGDSFETVYMPQGSTEQINVKIKLIKVFNRILPDVDEKFVSTFLQRQGTLEELRTDILKNIRREIKINRVRVVYPQIINGLLDLYSDFTPPAGALEYWRRQVIESRYNSLRKSVRGNLSFEQIVQEFPDRFQEAEILQTASRNYTTLLLLNHFRNKFDIVVTNELLDEFIDQMAIMFEYPEGYKQQIKKEKATIDKFAEEVFNNLLVERFLKESTVSENALSYRSLVNQGVVFEV